ncbi:hypothetical protein [Candidatus Oleimmundimicrobium sp.]|uniref:DUF7544 domain-containing protein n=1 Tax=Candidatus Oleimmundimicrobium sp. TaxID=3060597 RepID=UPI0027204253|nr:hypothetical protein [Candidatus Oleimmundimicrobium sp.]MDO8886313.1 hypothetical protein [Candidatus Oleimmundimicrobium sp.]
MDYVGILVKSAKMMWKHKSMWFFGILLGILSGGPNLQYIFRGSDFDYYNAGEFAQQMERVFKFFTPQVVMVLFSSFLIFMMVSIILQYLCRGALISMVDDIENSGETQIGRGFNHGWSNWLRLFGISFFIWVSFTIGLLLLFGVLSLPVILAFVKQKETFGFILLFPSILIFVILIIVVAIPLTLTYSFAERFCVIENKKLFESISEGYRLFKLNLKSSLLMWLLMYAINIGFAIVIVIFGFIFILPIKFTFSANAPLSIVILLPVTTVLILAGGLYKTFVFTVWTLFFKELKNKTTSVISAS